MKKKKSCGRNIRTIEGKESKYGRLIRRAHRSSRQCHVEPASIVPIEGTRKERARAREGGEWRESFSIIPALNHLNESVVKCSYRLDCDTHSCYRPAPKHARTHARIQGKHALACKINGLCSDVI